MRSLDAAACPVARRWDATNSPEPFGMGESFPQRAVTRRRPSARTADSEYAGTDS